MSTPNAKVILKRQKANPTKSQPKSKLYNGDVGASEPKSKLASGKKSSSSGKKKGSGRKKY